VNFIERAEHDELVEVFVDTKFTLSPIDAGFRASMREENESGNVDTGTNRRSSVGALNEEKPLESEGNAQVNGEEGSTTSSRAIVEISPLGKERRVTAENAQEYATLVERFRLNECRGQIDAMKRGIAPLVPTRLLPMFTWQELENLVCGVADVNVNFLHSRTKYVGDVKITDKHIKFFWDMLSLDFSPSDRTAFLRFVWGRERMSTAENSATFVIGPHVASKGGNPDSWLPVAHTCFFSLDLPRYSSREIMRERFLYAIRETNVIDADATAESASNLNIDFS